MKYLRKTGILIIIAFTTIVSTVSCAAMAGKSSEERSANNMLTLTVAKVIEDENKDYVTVVFLESARFYKLMRSDAGFKEYLAKLKKAEKNSSAVKVRLVEPYGEIIEAVE